MSAPIYSERPSKTQAPEQGRGLIRTLALVSVVVAGASLMTSLQFGSRDGAVVQIQHRVAFVGCGAARFVSLAPAQVGRPGYWRHLDRDNNGVSCEPSDRS